MAGFAMQESRLFALYMPYSTQGLCVFNMYQGNSAWTFVIMNACNGHKITGALHFYARYLEISGMFLFHFNMFMLYQPMVPVIFLPCKSNNGAMYMGTIMHVTRGL